MTVTDREQARSEEDYRLSHLSRGPGYDATLAGTPFDAYMARVESEHLRRIIPALFPDKRPRHLDFACGTGRITEVVAPLCAESTGVDISPGMLEQARRKCPTVRFMQTDLTQSKGVDLGRFDLVTAFRFFGNAQQALRVSVLQALHGLLDAEGFLVINSHRNPLSISALLQAMTGGGASGMDLHYFKLKSLLRRCGFRVVMVVPVAAWMFRAKLQNTQHEAARAARLERRFGSASLAVLAPDAVVIAKKVA